MEMGPDDGSNEWFSKLCTDDDSRDGPGQLSAENPLTRCCALIRTRCHFGGWQLGTVVTCALANQQVKRWGAVGCLYFRSWELCPSCETHQQVQPPRVRSLTLVKRLHLLRAVNNLPPNYAAGLRYWCSLGGLGDLLLRSSAMTRTAHRDLHYISPDAPPPPPSNNVGDCARCMLQTLK